MIPFAKWQGCGNDFVLVQSQDLCRAGLPNGLNPSQIAQICDRNFGVGSDGLVTIETLPQGLVCHMWNPDGSRSGMCGNGIRCAALYSRNAGIWQSGDRFWMSERKVGVTLDGDLVQVQMGMPSGDPWDAARTDLPPTRYDIAVQGVVFEAWGVSFGNPHMVILTDDLAAIDLAKYGPRLEKHPALPASTNVHFVQVTSPNSADVLHWERGAGRTLACGSGACSVYTVLKHLNRVKNEVSLNLPGGVLKLSFSAEGVMKSGPAGHSFSGFLSLAP